MSASETLQADASTKQTIIRPWRELSLFATILMEMSWVTLWYRVLDSAPARDHLHPDVSCADGNVTLGVSWKSNNRLS